MKNRLQFILYLVEEMNSINSLLKPYLAIEVVFFEYMTPCYIL
jgi:hypothetical protein